MVGGAQILSAEPVIFLLAYMCYLIKLFRKSIEYHAPIIFVDLLNSFNQWVCNSKYGYL